MPKRVHIGSLLGVGSAWHITKVVTSTLAIIPSKLMFRRSDEHLFREENKTPMQCYDFGMSPNSHPNRSRNRVEALNEFSAL